MFKKLISILCVLSLCLSTINITSVLAADAVLSASVVSDTCNVGDSVVVNFDLSDNPGFGSLQFDITYDTNVLKYVSYEIGSVKGDFADVAVGEGKLTYGSMAFMSNITSNGTVLTVTFEAVADGVSNVEISNMDFVAIDDTAELGQKALNITGASTSITVIGNTSSSTTDTSTETTTTTVSTETSTQATTTTVSTETSTQTTTITTDTSTETSTTTTDASTETTTTYTVSFRSNGGDSIDDITAVGGSSIELPIPIRDGYAFKGWFKESTFENEFKADDIVESDLRLYAKWNRIITLSFDSNGGSSVADISVEQGATVTLPTSGKDGCEFGGWYLDGLWSKPYTDTTEAPAYDITLYAKWIKTMPTESEIKAKYSALNFSSVSNKYDQTPSVTAPYSAGKLSSEMVKNGLDYLNFVRFVEGLQPVSIDDSKADLAQHGAVLLSCEYGHTPSKPSDMDESFYGLGYEATSTSNIAWSYGDSSYTNLANFVKLWLGDEDSTNIDAVGHRRWLINPYMLTTAFGYAESGSEKYANVLAFDESNDDVDYYDFIAYPVNGNFPNNIIDNTIPWSVSLNTSLYKVESANDINVRITKKSNGQTWNISQADHKANPKEGDKYFNYEDTGCGIDSCIIFSIGSSNISTSDLAGEFDVEITGLKDAEGNDTSINYTTNFFNASTSGSDSSSGGSSSSGSSRGSSGGGGGSGSSTSYYTIKLEANNDSTATSKKVVKNSTLTKPADPEREGYKFTGWYTDTECTKKYDFTSKVTSSFTLYAGWEKITDAYIGEDEEDTEAKKDTSSISEEVRVTIGSNVVVIGDKSYNMDVAPYIQTSSSSTLVPLRFVTLAICGDDVENADRSSIINWNAETKTATINADGKVIQFTAGSNVMLVDGRAMTMDNGVQAEITNSRMFIPFRALGEALDVDVTWEADTKMAVYTGK